MRRTFALWLLMFAAYCSTIGLDKGRASDEGQVHFLRVVDAVGEGTAVELVLAAIAALGVALAYRVALRVVPDPWSLGAAAAVGLSPPFLAYGSATYPELTAGAALAGAALLAIRLDRQIGRRVTFGCFTLLGLLPWLGLEFVPAGLVIGYLGARAVWRARRRTLAVGAVEVSLFSCAVYVGVNEALYGGPTPYAAGEMVTGAASATESGLLRWAPVFLLVFAGLWWLWRSHRDRLARAVPDLREVELAASMCAAVLGVQLLVAAVLAPAVAGDWFSVRHLLAALPLAIPLVALGLRRHPRIGAALAVLTLAASAWLYVDVRFGSGSF